jgi:hypothetical protein
MSRAKGDIWQLQLRKVQFCPWCGVASLNRDDEFNPASKQQPCPAFLCGACGKGFTVHLSPRAQYALRMIAEDRRNKY